ncbi:hypothetical protein [Anatilimnocola floriformis]|uniref:hypothetical protein n=1 Tax=Anatilimnocola floriformis TaxID=2948575 RepID=UPI0020C3E1C2|nr:hypothetical protein [Anatilimnocola floriformis]
MKKVVVSVCLLTLICVSAAHGQDPIPFVAQAIPSPSDAPSTPPSIPGVSPSQMTPQMYLYLHEQKRQDDPQQAVRRKAELKTAQRNQRLAAQKWFGVSNSRPMASAQPFMDLYSPRWTGNGYNSFDWQGAQNGVAPIVVVDPTIRR